MPSLRAASQMSVPGGTLISRPSIVIVTSSCCSPMTCFLPACHTSPLVAHTRLIPDSGMRMRRDGHATRPQPDEAAMRRNVVKVFVVEQLDAAGDGHRRGIAQRAEAAAQHVVADIGQQRNIALFAV